MNVFYLRTKPPKSVGVRFGVEALIAGQIFCLKVVNPIPGPVKNELCLLPPTGKLSSVIRAIAWPPSWNLIDDLWQVDSRDVSNKMFFICRGGRVINWVWFLASSSFLFSDCCITEKYFSLWHYCLNFICHLYRFILQCWKVQEYLSQMTKCSLLQSCVTKRYWLTNSFSHSL